MTTANSSALPLNPGSGRAFVTLTSYSGPITWGTTPVSGDQIEYPTAVSVNAAGEISGAGGTYTIRHIIASTGAVQSVSYTLTAGNSANAIVPLNIDSANFGIVTLTSYTGTYNFAVTPVAGDQLIYPDTVTINADGSFVGANATYTIYHVRQTGIVEAISYTHVGTNTAPSFGSISDVVANIGDAESFDISASDPDTGDILSYAADVLPRNGISLSGSVVSGTYTTEETFLCTFTVQDDSGDTGNDSDTTQVLFSIARAGYTITTLTVNYAGLNVDSPLIVSLEDSPGSGTGDVEVGDQIDYPTTAIDAIGNTRAISFSSDGIMTVDGTRSIKVDNIYIRDKSNGYARTGPFSVTQKNTGPVLTSPLEVVPNSPTTSGGQMRFTADESGNYRLIVIPSGYGTPTRAQVMAGLGPDGNAPLFDSGLQSQTAAAQETVTVTGLPTQGAGYWVFLALEDQYGGVSLEGPVTLTTTASGQPPVWSTVPNQSWTEGTLETLNLRSYCTDAITFSISGLSLTTTLTFNQSTGVLTGTPDTNDATGAPGSTTTRTITATATNATGSTQTTFDISFYRLNPPVASGSIPNQTWKVDQAASISLSSVITGATTYELQIDNGGFADGTAELATYNLTFNSSTGSLTGTPNASMVTNSPYSMRARGVNADGTSAWITFTATVNQSTAAGFFGPIPNQNLSEGTAFSVNLSSYYTNANSYTISGRPAGSGINFDTATGVLSGTPNSADAAAAPFVLTITAINPDGNAPGDVTVLVSSLQRPVLVTAFPNLELLAGSGVLIVPGNNFTGETSITLGGLPVGSGLTFDGTTLTGSLNAVDRAASPLVLTFTATNNDGQTADTFLITVTGAILVNGSITTPTVRTVSVAEKRSLSPKVYIQDSADRIDYAIDLSTWLGADTIDTVVVSDGAAFVDAGIKESNKYMVFVTGGTNGESERISCRTTTVAGRVVDVSFYVAFVDM